MLTVHHLGVSQSERIVWLCEELGLTYELKHYDRDSATQLAPPEYKALHPMGAAPVISDGDLVMAESGAIVEYILGNYGDGRLGVGAAEPGFAEYLYWFHFTNGSLQPAIGRMLIAERAAGTGSPFTRSARDRLAVALGFLERRLAGVPWLAGGDFTAADIMIVFTLTTMRHFQPFDLVPYPEILAYLQRIAQRPAYRTAMVKGDPGMTLLLT